ncbi:MAG: hypothetical protein HZB53_06140 [Chloroflexi bacterium]|nr:hypothetical protein [Chloroflexota bacterium]
MRTPEFPRALGAHHAKALAFQPDPGERFYALCEAHIAPGAEPVIIVRVQDAAGNLAANVYVTQEWPDGHETLRTAAGQVTFHLGPGSRFRPPRGGPHRVYVGKPESLTSDLVYSLGSPNGRALSYELTFAETTG